MRWGKIGPMRRLPNQRCSIMSDKTLVTIWVNLLPPKMLGRKDMVDGLDRI